MPDKSKGTLRCPFAFPLAPLRGLMIFIEVNEMEITRETRIAEIIENCPQAMPAFMEIGMHCMGCALASGETLEQACAAHGVDPDEFLVYLKAFLETA